MELQSFVMRNFKPREKVRERGEAMVAEALKKVAAKGQVKIVIMDQGASFIISGVAHTDNRFFSSESYHYKSDLWGWPRDWQVEALNVVVKDLVQQVGAYLRKAKRVGGEVTE